jgi:hypothetical protein
MIELIIKRLMSCILDCCDKDFILEKREVREDSISFNFKCSNWRCWLFVMNTDCEDISFLQVYVCEIENVKNKRVFNCESNLVLD